MKQHARTDDDDGTTCRDEWIWGKKTINLKLKEEEEEDDHHHHYHHQSIYNKTAESNMHGWCCLYRGCWLLLLAAADVEVG